MANGVTVSGSGNTVVIDDKDTINKTKNVTVDKTVNVEKTVVKADTERLETGQEQIFAELSKIAPKLTTLNNKFDKLLKLIEKERVGE